MTWNGIRRGLAGAAAASAVLWATTLVGACSSSSSTTDGGNDTDATAGCGAGSVACGGVCTVVARDSENCGACGTKCGAGEVCSQGACALSCGGGTTKCGSVCVSTQTDGDNCGGCGTKCTTGQVCSKGACASSCGQGLTQCGQSCVNQQNDRTNCGGCGTVCNAGEICNAGKCELSCQVGLIKCTASIADGGVADAGDGGALGATYCVNPLTDEQNCGGCGVACANGQKCTNGACATTCGGNDTLCSVDGGAPYCANLQTSNQDCGACGVPCAPGKVCSNGTCQTTCAGNLTTCGNGNTAYCADTKNDNTNCGTCGTVCKSQEKCVQGTCAPKCAQLLTNVNVWGLVSKGLDLQAYTNGTLDWIGCTSDGCPPASFFCTDEPKGIFFGTTDPSALRALVDPGNAAGAVFPTSDPGCASANTPRGICNGPRTDNDGVGGINAADALCKALHYTSGVVVVQGTGNYCPRPYTTTPNGSDWNSQWNGGTGVYGQQYRCSNP